MVSPAEGYEARRNIPNPDPSDVTQRLLDGAKTDLRREFELSVDGLRGSIENRLAASDAARMAGVPPGEELTWRSGIVRQVEALIGSVKIQIQAADEKAQTSNDTLQQLILSHLAAANKLADVRFEAAQMAIVKVDAEIRKAYDAASAAVGAVDDRSSMRHDKAVTLTIATEQKLINRTDALKSLVDLRAEMSQAAITKADEATEMRFQSVNEFRQTLSDQARNFVTLATLDSRVSTVSQQITAVEQQGTAVAGALQTQLQARLESINARVASLDTAVASLTGKVIVGGSGIMLVLLVVQVVLNLLHK